MSSWIGQVDSQKQPRNAVTVMYLFGAALLCTILPSQVAFFSLVSAGGIPTTAAYGLIALLRLIMTPNEFKSSYFYLGKWRKPFYACAAFFNAIVFAVSSTVFSLRNRLILMLWISRHKYRRFTSLLLRTRSTSYAILLLLYSSC